MLYKMIYFLSHKFAFSNLRFSPFYEHFRQLREKYAFKLKRNKVHHDVHTYLLKKPLHPLHVCTLHLPIQNIFLAVNPFHCFLQKVGGPGKKYFEYIHTVEYLKILLCEFLLVFTFLLCLRPQCSVASATF